MTPAEMIAAGYTRATIATRYGVKRIWVPPTKEVTTMKTATPAPFPYLTSPTPRKTLTPARRPKRRPANRPVRKPAPDLWERIACNVGAIVRRAFEGGAQ